MNPFFLHL
jgi:hypothetical protein